MTKLKLLGKHFYNLGLNVTCISNRLTEHNFYDPNLLKAPYHKWKHLKLERQKEDEFDNFEWNEATGLGTIAGFNNLHILDIDGCSNDDFINDILLILGLPRHYEWVVKTGSQDGYHIYFYSNLFDELENNQVCSTFPANKENIGLFEKMELLWSTHVVLPNSMHKSGDKYKFVNSNFPTNKPAQIDIKRFDVIVDLFLNRSKLIKKKNYFNTWTEEVKLKQPSNLDLIDLSTIKKNLIFIFDTETDGLIKNESFPNIIQISWMIMDYDGIVYKKNTELINCDFNPNSDAFKVNKIKPDIIRKLGVEPEEAYLKIMYDLKYCVMMSAHNLDFDYPVLKNEFYKYNIDFDFSQIKRFCTMKWGHSQLKNESNPDPKYPKLTELYEYLFNHSVRQYHNSHSDVVILSKIIKEILFNQKK
jgi:DNA polymerase III epsilon subunit-like protein